MVPRFRGRAYNRASRSVAESENVQILWIALGAHVGGCAHFASPNILLAGQAVYQFQHCVISIGEEPILARRAGLVIRTGTTSGKSEVAEQVNRVGPIRYEGVGAVVTSPVLT